MSEITTADELRMRLAQRRSLPAPSICRALRETAGASRAEVAALCGVTAASVGLWESGSRRPVGDHLTRYLEALDLLKEAAA